MADITPWIQVYTPTLAGAEAEYVLPSNAKSIQIFAQGGAVTFTDQTGGETVSIADGASLAFDNRNLQGASIWLNGAAGTCKIIVEKGLAN